MQEYDLAIIIPARNEEFLPNTVRDILEHKRARTQVIVGLDGAEQGTPLTPHPDVVVLHYPESIGQRAISNQCAQLARTPYLMKVDAHCAFDEGFDAKLLNLMQPDITMVPVMRNLHAFDWVCANGHRRYQGPSGVCTECGTPTVKDIVWIPKTNPQSTAYRFDRTMKFQYWNEFGKRQKGDLTETLSIQGSCFLVTRARWWELDICSETFSSWGQQGVEVACKSWLSGGRVLVNRTTWYAHMFRTQGGDFGFPYPLAGADVDANRELSRQLFERDGWPGAKRKFQWLIDKFHPPDWEQAIRPTHATGPSKGILYYTDNALNMRLARTCRDTITAAGLPITSATLKPTPFGRNIVVVGERGYKTMFRQIEAGLAAMTEDVVFFCEHDCLYHPSHFDFTPERRDCFYYDGHWWSLRLEDGFAVSYDICPLAGLVAYREPLLRHFRERNALIEKKGFGYWMGFEPMTHRRVKWDFWCDFEIYQAAQPNIDLAHGGNLTKKRFSQERFIRKPTFWKEADVTSIPGWPDLPALLQGLDQGATREAA